MNKRVSTRLLSPRLLFVVLTVFAAATTAACAQSATGAQNATGAQAATGPASNKNVVTNWNPTVTYKVGQVVYCADCSTNGSRYIALIPNLNVDPPSNLNVIWQLVTPAGANGTHGNTGPTGATGSTGEPAHPAPPPPPSSTPPGM